MSLGDPFATLQGLLAAAGVQASPVGGQALRAVFSLPNGRGQQVIYSLAGTLSEEPILDIVSPIANLDQHPMSGEVALAVLRASCQLKVGAYVINRQLFVVRHACVLSGVTPTSLRAMTQVIAQAADQAEAELTGQNRM